MLRKLEFRAGNDVIQVDKDVVVRQKSEVDAPDAVRIVSPNPHITGSTKNKMFKVKGCKILWGMLEPQLWVVKIPPTVRPAIQSEGGVFLVT